MNREIEILKALNHENIIDYADYLNYNRDADLLITEYCQVRNLKIKKYLNYKL